MRRLVLSLLAVATIALTSCEEIQGVYKDCKCGKVVRKHPKYNGVYRIDLQNVCNKGVFKLDYPVTDQEYHSVTLSDEFCLKTNW